MSRISHLVGDWTAIFHGTYSHVDSSQRTDFESGSLQRGGIRLHASVANMSKKIPPALRASVHLLSGHASYITVSSYLPKHDLPNYV